jgi:actin-like ATPase involved in cell morphogenesis
VRKELSSFGIVGVPSARNQRERDAVITEAQSKRARHVAMQRSDMTAASAGVVENAIEQAHGAGAIQTAHIGLGFVEPFDPAGRHYFGVTW